MTTAEPLTEMAYASLVEVWVDGPARTLVIPMYREQARIEATIAALAHSKLNDPLTELIFVDDGSDDDTAAIARAAMVTHRLPGFVLGLHRNVGKGGAVRAGILASRGRVVAFTDADLSTAPDEIDRCFEAVERGADVAVGSRGLEDSVIVTPQPRLRQLSGRIFNFLVRSAGLTQRKDTQCGLKAFTRDSARRVFWRLETRGFAFDVEVLCRAERAGYNVVDVPVAWQHCDSSRVRPVRDGLAMFREVRRLRRVLLVDANPVVDLRAAHYDAVRERTLVIPDEV